ncbi:L-methionine gamma-lyase [Acrasis kona]|uniref:L-methionine gamma-lyase n=1 Tax=Acrasis kona TaxID=1008807 RepID=A0AAW2ZMD8_9EUKA
MHRIDIIREHLRSDVEPNNKSTLMNNTSSKHSQKEQILKNAHFSTRAVSKGYVHSSGFESALPTPIVASSTFELDDVNHGAELSAKRQVEGKSPFLYSRWSNPTSQSAASQITRLEEAFGTHLCSSGMAAISTVLFGLLSKGDHIIVFTPVYGGTHEILSAELPRYGIDVTWVNDHHNNPNAMEEYSKLVIKGRTKVIYSESPGNPTLSITDLLLVSALGIKHDLVSVVDSTFASPYTQTPIATCGMDVVIHSCSKYMGGHSDLIAGSITSRTEDLHLKFFQQLKLFGGVLGPFDSFLLARGIKTLDVRMERHNRNAQLVAEFLNSHEKIDKVFYPGLKQHPQHELATKQMKGYGGMVSFEVRGGVEAGIKLVENLKLIVLAVSLGGVETLVEQPSTMTHGMVSKVEREKVGINDSLIRLSTLFKI